MYISLQLRRAHVVIAHAHPDICKCRMTATSILRKTVIGLGLTSASSLLVGPTVTAGARCPHLRSSMRAAVSCSVLESPSLPAPVAREPATHPAFELVKVEMVCRPWHVSWHSVLVPRMQSNQGISVCMVTQVDEYTIKCAMYRHKKSGAELISAHGPFTTAALSVTVLMDVVVVLLFALTLLVVRAIDPAPGADSPSVRARTSPRAVPIAIP